MKNTSILKSCLGVIVILICWMPSLAQVDITLRIFKSYAYGGNVGINHWVTVENLPGTPAFSQVTNTNSAGRALFVASRDATPPHQWRVSSQDPCTGATIFDTITVPDNISASWGQYLYVCRDSCFGTLSPQGNYSERYRRFLATSRGFETSTTFDFGDGLQLSYPGNTTGYFSNQFGHVYAPGNYNVCVTAQNNYGCFHSMCTNITILPSSGCGTGGIEFRHYENSSSSGFDTFRIHNSITQLYLYDNIVEYSISYGDGSTDGFFVYPDSNGAVPSIHWWYDPFLHSYSLPGVYNVCLTQRVYSSNNVLLCTETFCEDIFHGVNPCNASFNYSNLGNTYSFHNTSTGSNLSYGWNFGDGTTSTQQNPVHTYSQGVYSVCLVISNSAGCTDTACNTITVTNTGISCNAAFTYADSGTVYYFQNNSTGNFNHSLWNFGDGTSSSNQNPAHTYAPGTYNACLYIYDSTASCSDSTCSVITVGGNTGPCNASFSYTVNGHDVTFTNTSSPNQNVSAFWTFGDSTTPSTHPNPTHTYAQNGTYQACLTIVDNTSGCSDNTCLNLLISSTTQQHYCISGNVSKGGAGNAAYPATVYLIYNDTVLGTLTSIRTAATDQGGNYQFCNVPVGRFLVKAALDAGAANYSSYVPTYFGNSLFWSYATEIVLLNQNATQKNIWLVANNNPGGPGFVGGFVSQGANKMAGPGDPLEGVEVMLLDMNDSPVQYTYSDASGRFEFSSIAYGTYKVYAEVPGIPTYPNIVTLSAENATAENVNVVVESAQIISGLRETPTALRSIKMYPNPTTAEVNMEWTGTENGQVHLLVTDLAGKMVIEEILYNNVETQTHRVDLSQQRAGVYLVRIAGKDDSRSFKVVKY